LLKDVTGLVPGAYQARGRGNQFLNDLCDATVLIHVVDASGTVDAQGNMTATDRDESVFTKRTCLVGVYKSHGQMGD
jgi:ribosome-binding ATPase YchF (GTP1/OBG family)